MAKRWAMGKKLKIRVRRPAGDAGRGESSRELAEENEEVLTELFRKMGSSAIAKHGDKSDPLYRILYHPTPRGGKKPAGGGESQEKRRDALRHVLTDAKFEADTGKKLPKGAGTWFRRVIPKNHRPGGKLPEPDAARKAGFKPGPYMERNEAGAVGEALVFLNADLRSSLESAFDGEMTLPESINIEQGRRLQSPFDFYIGEWGIELKTVALQSNGRASVKVNDNGGSGHQYGIDSSRGDFASQNGIKQAVVALVIDQKSGRAWMHIHKLDEDTIMDTKSFNYSKGEIITPAKGVKVTEADIYQAYWVSTQPVGLRRQSDGTAKYVVRAVGKGKNRRIEPVGRPDPANVSRAVDPKQLDDPKLAGDKMKYGS